VDRLSEEHLERHILESEDRFKPREGSLGKVVPTAVESHLACGRREGGFAWILGAIASLGARDLSYTAVRRVQWINSRR